MAKDPAYLRIAAELRARIQAGDLTPGDKLPSQNELREQYGVANAVAVAALDRLQADGLVERRRGSGTYVRDQTRLVRRAHARNMRATAGSTSPFARDAARAGKHGRWEHHSERTTAGARIAARLGIQPDDPVMRTRYRFLADASPVQLSESTEPLAITAGTPVEWPEEGAAVGVVARMDLIGVHIDRFVEEVTTRPAAPDEVEALALSLRASAWVIVIERTYYAGDVAVETADIVFPGDRYRLVYEMPVDPAPSA